MIVDMPWFDAPFDRMMRWFARPERARTVLFDADCGVCMFVSRVLERLDPFGRLTFVGNAERERFPETISEELLDRTLVVILPDGQIATEGRAVLEALRALPFGILAGWWLCVPGLANIGNALYRLVARNRARISGWLGLTACRTRPKVLS
jgi:predicted DCC family thiol-disulfide oxidoreductase YuxK